MSFYCFSFLFIGFSLCIFVIKPNFSLQCFLFVAFIVNQIGDMRTKRKHTSLQKDLGMRQGGSQELLSIGGFTGGQPPAGKKTIKPNRVHVFKGIQRTSTSSVCPGGSTALCCFQVTTGFYYTACAFIHFCSKKLYL